MSEYRKLELYIHIPFCIRKCAYCDFLSAPADEKSRFVYVKALINEIAYKAQKYDAKAKYLVTSVFVGGGTPTVLDGSALCEILECIRNNYNLEQNAEITFECNPGTADFSKLKECFEGGFNRISIGLQSALDDELKAIGRIHDWQDFLRTYNAAVEAGFKNINVDLMSALPGQTMERLSETVDKILALQPRPNHISSYSLILEEGTAFWKRFEEGNLNLPDEDTERQMHWMIIDRLEQEGYREYELSNLAKPGYECRHNIGYWIRTEYLGMGTGAASLIGKFRKSNTRDLSEYIEFYSDSSTSCGKNEPLSELIELTQNDEMEEYMFLGLRMTSGVSKKDFEVRFGIDIDNVFGKVTEKNISEGLLECEGDRLFLTRRGQDLANYVFAQYILG